MEIERNRALLELQGVSFSIRGRALISDVDLKVTSGEILTLIGPNGAGKTTLLKLALGLLPPTAGEVVRAPGTTIGYMPQKLHIDPSFPLSARRFLSLSGKTSKGAREKALAEVGISQLADSPVQSLSGGELQRLLLARALLRNPDLLVLDEPAQGVDVHGQAELYQLLARIRSEHGCAILMVSHDLHLVMAATDRVICLNHHVCCTGTPESVAKSSEFVALFGSAASNSLAIYSHDTSHHQGHDHG